MASLLEEENWEMLPHPQCSSDLNPSEHVCGSGNSDNKLKKDINKGCLAIDVHLLPYRWKLVIDYKGGYIEEI